MKCGKCARANVYICRVNNIQCCEYCNCKAETCQNSLSWCFLDFMLGLFYCMSHCFLIKILLKDMSVSLSSLSSIPTSKTCNFFQRHFYTLRLKFFLISINFAIEWYTIWLHSRSFTNCRVLRPNGRFFFFFFQEKIVRLCTQTIAYSTYPSSYSKML